ncbi:MAG: (2Fe-2S)-binding protein [Chloroflexi bacterium]|nr:(2Fe-2S)-binding protein [Chloroflexota bacterium]
MRLELTVNGLPENWEVAPGETLLEAIRAHDLRGTKLVCGTGDCCGCTVILNGQSLNSCSFLALQAQHGDLLTIEGLASPNGELHPLQAAFLSAGAAQCGFCTSGFIMRAYDFLNKSPDPTEEQVRHALAGNICRCTGYVKPVEAVLAAARVMAEPGG